MATLDELKQAQAAAAKPLPDDTTQPVTPVTSSQSAAAPAAAPTAAPAAAPQTANPITANPSPQAQAISQMYAAQRDARLSELKSAYDQSVSKQQAAAEQIPATYQQRANDLAIQYERNHRNFHEGAAASGINTGTAAQEELAFANNYGRDYGRIQTAQADAQAEAQRTLADLETDYQGKVASALATNNYQEAAALLDEYNNQYSRDMQQAQTLASYGDFSMYASLYGPDQAAAMEAAWKAQNPLLAYNTGKLSAEDYRKMTGSYPPGFAPAVNPYLYSGGGGKKKSATSTDPDSKDGTAPAAASGSSDSDPSGTLGDMNFAYLMKNPGSMDSYTTEQKGAVYRSMTPGQRRMWEDALKKRGGK